MGVNFFIRNARDARFVLFEHLNVFEKLQAYESFQDLSPKAINMIVEEALKFARDVLGPTMQDGDREGCIYNNGEVTFPVSYQRAWQLYGNTGWIGLINDPEDGGQGLPMVIAAIVSEFFQGANCTMAIGAELTAGAAGLIERFGSMTERKLYVEKMYTGQWSGTMALTEPEAGSDVGKIATKAVPETHSDVSRVYRIEGTKQFITWGEHNLTENIIHLVLARIEGAPTGTKGLSLFVVPKRWVEEDGSLGEFNDVFCSGVEHKMGQHASSTCSLVFGAHGACRGILLGSPTDGIAKMFQMMNELRLHSGLQGMALASAAYDTARQYAKTRVQGTPFTNPKGAEVEIVKHEDIRRMLMNLKAGTEALRALVAMVFYLGDQAHHDPDEGQRKVALQQFEFFIPVVKICGADFSYELIRDAIQILGGVGYCRDFPVEQYSRDSKVNSIVEGTSYIQARDLVTRKLGLGGKGNNQAFSEWCRSTMEFIAAHISDVDFALDRQILQESLDATKAIAELFERLFQSDNGHLVALNATRFAECVADVSMGKLMLEQGLIARDKLRKCKSNSADGIFYQGKIETAHFFCRNFLPRTMTRQQIIAYQDRSAIDIPEAAI